MYTIVFLFGKVCNWLLLVCLVYRRRVIIYDCNVYQCLVSWYNFVPISDLHSLWYVFQYLLPPKEEWCPYSNMSRNIHHYNNPDYNYHPCQRYRTHRLMFLNLQEIEFAQRMILSVLLGGVIGFERRASERPAGKT